MALPVQQNRCGDCGHVARRADLGHACDLPGRVSSGVLEFALAGSPSCPFSPIWTAPLHALARIFASCLANILACVCWVPVPRGSFRNHHIFCDAVAAESRSDASEERVSVPAAAGGGRGCHVCANLGNRGQRPRLQHPFANQDASIKVLRFEEPYAFTT